MNEPNETDGMTTAPKFVPDNNTPAAAPPEVPQWLYDASTEVSARRMGVLPEYVLEIIASHAPQPEAQPATATEGEEATGGGFRTSKAFTAQAWKDHGEAREPEAMTKWPRYLENAEHRGIYSRRMFDSPTHLGRWCDGSDSVLELTFDEVMAEGGCIETDAAGNALPASPPATNFTRHAEPKNYLSVCNQCRTKFDATGKCDCDRVSVSCQMPTLSEQPGSASGVETMKYTVKRMGTFGGSPLYTATFQVHGEMQVVTAADHDRLLAERDGEIATLRTRLLRAEQRDAEAEKYASGISENLSGFLQLAELGCSVHRNAVVNRPRYYVADVDGKIVSEADEILAAMRNVAMPFNNGG